MLKPAEVLTVIKSRPDILPLLTSQAKAYAFGEEAYFKAIERDPAEPHRKEKMRFEKRMAALMQRIFDRQKETVRPQIAAAQYTKADDYNLDWTDDEKKDFISLIMEIYGDGMDMFRQEVFDGFSDEFVNVGMQAAARKYAYDLIKIMGQQLNQTTVDGIRDAVSMFAEPGVTIGDVMERLPFNPDRSLRIAVTEITRAYATATQEAGMEMQREFPDLTVIKTWYTNQDDRVCDICGPLHMTSVKIDDSWGGIDNPPSHIGCRCFADYGTTLGNVEMYAG